MKHKWIVTPRGKKTKYFTCERCGLKIYTFSFKDANKYYPICIIKKERNDK